MSALISALPIGLENALAWGLIFGFWSGVLLVFAGLAHGISALLEN